ncbi:MAG: hypothetical protein J7M18_06520 [Candidatus Eremiobacteraeota bacterium]|nr:hypothetical protein [Candidatus Eremiobacteraeota bacterium]
MWINRIFGDIKPLQLDQTHITKDSQQKEPGHGKEEDIITISSEAIEEVNMPEIPRDTPPYGTAEMYNPYLVMSGKGVLSPGERLAPVKMNFDGDWDILNNKKNYKDTLYGNEKVGDVSAEQGATYVHEMFTEIDGEKYKVYQYWYYWAENPFYIDQHEHDLQYVQVYVKEDGTPRYIYTNSHFDPVPYVVEQKGKIDEGGNRAYSPSEIKWHGSHPVVFVGQGSHALVGNRDDFNFYDKCNDPPVYQGVMPNIISLDDVDDPDNPFPNGQDIHGLLDKNGNLKNHGFWQNPFVRVKGFYQRKAFKEGAHSLTEPKPSLWKRFLRFFGLGW